MTPVRPFRTLSYRNEEIHSSTLGRSVAEEQRDVTSMDQLLRSVRE